MLKQTNVATAGGEDGWFSVPNAQLPTWLKTNTGTISFAFWFRKEANVTTFRHMIGVDQASANAPQWGLRYSDTTILLQLFDNAGTEVRRAQVSTGYPVNGEWCVVVGYVDRTGKHVGLGVVREGNPSGNFQTDTSGSGTGTIDTPNGSLVVGSRLSKANYGTPVTTAGVMGGMVFVKDVQLALSDAVAMFNAKKPWFGLFPTGTTNFPGRAATDWVFLPMCPLTEPQNAGGSTTPGQSVGDTLGTNGCVVLMKGGSVTDSDSLFTLRSATLPGNVQAQAAFVDPYVDYSAFFAAKAVPGASTLNGKRVGRNPVARRYGLNAPIGDLDRILHLSNSRGMRPSDKNLATLPENHAHGFINKRFAKCKGVLCAPVYVNAGRWFGADRPTTPVYAGSIYATSASNAYSDFSRFGTHSGNTAGPGPGMLRILASTAVFRQLFRDMASGVFPGMPDSLFRKSSAITVEAVYLRAPKMDDFDWSNYEASAQDAAGSQVGPTGTTTDADTTVTTRTMNASDTYNAGAKTLDINLDSSNFAGVSVGDVVVISSGTGLGSVAAIASITPSSGRTIFGLKHVFGTGPATGDTLAFGPWAFGKISYTAPATSADFRGPRIAAKGTSGRIGVGLCWFNAWVPTIDGFVIGGAGWSGQGFTPQLDQGISEDLPARIAKACGATLVVLHMANQSTNPSDLLRMSTACRTGYSPGILWCGDQEHNPDEDATTGAWSNYVISASNPYCGVAIQEDAAIGDAESQFASGKKGNTYHPNAAGMAEAAQVALALFDDAALAADAKRKLGVGVGIGIG